MVTRKARDPARPFRVALRAPRTQDAAAFIAAARASGSLHRPWVRAPSTEEAFARYVQRYGIRREPLTHAGYLMVRVEDEALAGVFNYSEIIRGALQSAFLGYYAFRGSEGRGLMAEGLALALDAAFREIRLHRVEVNVQPDNDRSLALVERLSFVREGFSRRYVKIAGRWRDHVRFAMLAEDWPAARRRFVASLAAGHD